MKSDSSDLWNIIVLLKKVILGSFITIILIVAGFLIYLFSDTETHDIVTTKGVYNLVNSESGEIIATDLSQEDLVKIMEFINGGD